MTGDTAATDGADGRRGNPVLRRALTWYVLWSIAALALVAVGVVIVSGVIVRNAVLRDSERTARAVADSIIAPLATTAFHAGDPAAAAALGAAVASRSQDGSLLHVKLWADAGEGSGRIVYADESALVGQEFVMEPDEYALFGSTGTVTGISDLQKPENELERSAGELVEAYAGMHDATGTPLVFETYIPTDRLAEDSRELTRELLPLTLAALLVLALALLPLAVSLALRVDRAQRDRRRLLANAVESSDLERRRIAQDLHDGVIQDLAGVGYSLSSLSRQLSDEEARAQADEAAEIVRRDVSSLRTLLTDIYPPDLDHRGLAEAVRDLIGQDRLGSARVDYDVDEPLTPSPTTARLAFRVVREALRNVVAHASAAHVAVRLRQDASVLRFEITDDGVGFVTTDGQLEGHLGLRLMAETVADAGGLLTIASEPGHGTRVEGWLPL